MRGKLLKTSKQKMSRWAWNEENDARMAGQELKSNEKRMSESKKIAMT